MESSSRHVHTEHMGHGNTHEMHEVHGGPPNAEMHSGHDRHAGHSVAMFRDKFWLSLSSRFPWSCGRARCNTGWATVLPFFQDRDGSLPFWAPLFFYTAEVFSFVAHLESFQIDDRA